MTRILVLNGPGSVGKTTLARAIQRQAPRPFLHAPMDAFPERMPDALQDHPEGFWYRPRAPGGVEVATGPAGARLIRGMHRAMAALVAEGNDLIVDRVAGRATSRSCAAFSAVRRFESWACTRRWR